MSKTIAAVMIVKNEEALLARCLESVKGLDNLYILDTGSRDRTVEIARQYTDNVFLDSVWIADFSFHQNLIKSRVKEDFILSIDADEILESVDEVRKAVEICKDTVRVHMEAEGDPAHNFGFPRLFRNTPEIFWVQPIHKHLNVPGDGEEVGNVKITFGYSPAHLNDPDRSLRMLEQAVASEKEPVRNLYYLGREYYYKQRYQEAIDTFKRYIKVAHWLAELADAYFIMAQCYCELRMLEEMANATLQAILINPNFKEAVEFMASISIEDNQAQWNRMARTASNEGVLWKRVETERANDVIFLSSHNDDESLYGSFILQRNKPLVIVVTDGYIQYERGDLGCSAEVRRQETINAMAISGCPVVFLGIKDTELTEDILRERLKGFNPEKIYVPAIQGGNRQHDLVATVAMELFGLKCEHYAGYTKTELYTTGNVEIKPTQQEIDIKNKMLDCYKSQLELAATRPHFDAVRGQSEWLF